MSQQDPTSATLDQALTALYLEGVDQEYTRINAESSIRSSEITGRAWGDISDSESTQTTTEYSALGYMSDSESKDSDDCIIQEPATSTKSYAFVASGANVHQEEKSMNVLDVIDIDDSDSDHEYGEIKSTIGDDVKPKHLCRFFNTRRGCDKGDACKFKHERQVCAFFSSTQGCTASDDCPFIHDTNKTPSVQLKPCPNKDCPNLCIGKQCMQCHNLMNSHQEHKVKFIHRDRSPRRHQSAGGYDKWNRRGYRTYHGSREFCDRRNNQSNYYPYRSRSHTGREYPRKQHRIHACPEPDCRNTCLGRRCRECHLNSRTKQHTSDCNPRGGYRSDEGGCHDEK